MQKNTRKSSKNAIKLLINPLYFIHSWMHSLFIIYDARKSRGRENVTARGRLKSIDKESFWLEINICVGKFMLLELTDECDDKLQKRLLVDLKFEKFNRNCYWPKLFT